MAYSQLVDEAMAFAAIAHETQYRKDPTSRVPYIAHPAMVALLLTRLGFGDTTIAAAILHDVIEDTDAGHDDLVERFGVEVAMLVDHVTEQDKSLAWEVRKREYLRRLRAAPSEAVAISAADKIHNLQSILLSADALVRAGQDRAEVWAVFSRGPHLKLRHYREVASVVRDVSHGDARIAELGIILDRLLDEVAELAARTTVSDGTV